MTMTETHRSWIASRRTADGKIVHLWPDGAITWAMGSYVKGSAHARTTAQVSQALAAGWLVMGEVAIYDSDEVPGLVSAARWCVSRGLCEPGDVRSRLHRALTLRPEWTTIEADRDGKPRVRCWKLPRIRWPGLSVWADGATYSIWSEVGRSGTYMATGMEFSNLADLSAHLHS